MRALETEVVDAVFAAIEPLLPEPPAHPLGCHRPRVPDRLCFWGFLIRLTTGSSWVDIEAILEHRVSDNTLRTRRDEWITAGVFDQLCADAIAAFDGIIGLDLSEFAIDGSLYKAPYGGEGTGANPTDRAKRGWKWSIGVDRHGIPLGWAVDGANRNDVRLLGPTIDAIATNGWLDEIDTSTSTGVTTTRRSDANSQAPASMITSPNAAVNPAITGRSRSRSGCAGSSKRPTVGCRTMANSAAAPTARAATATPHSALPPPCASSANFSPGETAGTPDDTAYPPKSLASGADQPIDLAEVSVSDHEPTVSVVIPTFNRADRLRPVCEPLLEDPALKELIVVIDGSTDHTDSVMAQLGARDDRVRSIRIENSGVGAARAAGVVVASGDVVLFIDDDVIADKGLVSRHAARHSQADDRVVVGYMPTRTPSQRVRGDIFTLLYASEYDRRARTWDSDPSLVLEHLWQGNVSVRSKHLAAAPVHDPRFGYSYHEDQYFGWRLRDKGLIGVFDRSLAATHLHRVDIDGFRRIARGRGAGMWIAGRREHDEVSGRPRLLRLAVRAASPSGITIAGLLASATAAGAGLAGRLRWWKAERFSALALRRIEIWRGARLASHHDGWLAEWGPMR